MTDPSQTTIELELELPTFIMKHPGGLSVPAYLSVSKANKFRQCPRAWAFTRADRTPPNEKGLASSARIRGTWVHAVLERFYSTPASHASRSVEAAWAAFEAVQPELSADAEFVALELNEVELASFLFTVWSGVMGIFKLEKPVDVRVHAVEHEYKAEVAGIPTFGFIDRVDSETFDGESGLVVIDYKNGAPKPPYKRRDGSFDTPDYYHQMRWYAVVLRETWNRQVRAARLVHPSHTTIIEVPITFKDMEDTIEIFRDVWDEMGAESARLVAAGKNAKFAGLKAKPSPLCGWCDHVALCREGQGFLRERNYPVTWAAKPENRDKVMPAAGVLKALDAGVKPTIEWVPEDDGA